MIVRPDALQMLRVLNHIEGHFDLWDQSTWKNQTSCGTTYCFAGWTVVLSGMEVCDLPCEGDNTLHLAHVHHSQLTTDLRHNIEARGSGSFGLTVNCDTIYLVSTVARVILGLNTKQAMGLFCATNNLQTIRDLINRYTSVAQPPAVAGY